jgi:putative transposase
LEFSRNQFYYESKLEYKDKKMADKIEEQHEEDDTLGSRKLRVLLKSGRNRIRRIMSKYGIKTRRKKKKYEYPGKADRVFKNLANESKIKKNREIIFSDIFEIKLADRSKVKGCFALRKKTRQILSLVFDYSMKAGLVVETIRRINFLEIEKVIRHSDQGKQYGAKITIEEILKRGFEASMSRTGTPTDNPFAERFVGTFKLAVAEKKRYQTLGEFLEEAERWVNFYNKKKPHEALNNLSPNNFANKKNLQTVPYLTL